MEQLPELLMPAGDAERLAFALAYGADAVYLGADRFGMRSAPKNFTPDALAEAAALVHSQGKRIYLTLNTVPTNDEIAQLPDFLRAVRQAGLDAFIVTDLGVMTLCKKLCPEVAIHLSTQVGIMNYAAATAAWEMGASRVVLARELSLEQIAQIRQNTPKQLELEAFVHGAMCVSISGRCLLSQYLTSRDGNRGECAQPCRWKYALLEEKHPGEYYSIAEEEGGTYILNANDLCTAPFLNLILAAGVTSLKVEGRAKSFYYVASLAAAYRRALDAVLSDPTHYNCPEQTLDELQKSSHRPYSPGFYFGPEHARQNTRSGGYIREWEVVAVVEECKEQVAYCTQRGRFFVGQELEALLPNGDTFLFVPDWIENAQGEKIEATSHPMMPFYLPVPRPLPPMSILRRKL